MRNFVLSALAIILAIGLMGSAFAYFSDTETSSDNAFTTGTLDLKVKANGVWVDGVTTAIWSGSNMAPGDDLGSGAIRLKEWGGTLAGDHLEIGCDYTSSELPADNMAKYLEITLLTYENTDWYINGLTGEQKTLADVFIAFSEDWKVDDTDGVGGVSLYDLRIDSLDNLPAPGGSTHEFSMGLKYHEDAGDNLQGDTLDLTMKFTLNQVSSQ